MADVPTGYYRTELNRTVWVVPDKYQDLSPIGTGAYGQVCSATNTSTGERVAIKKLYRPFQKTMNAKRSFRGLKLLQHLSHENVISLLDVFTPNRSFEEFQDVYMVTDLMGADLKNVLQCNKVTDEHVQFLVYQMLRGLKYIHSAGVIHRKLEPRNMAVNEDCELKILDFGQARMADEEMTGYVGNRWYRAPEIMLNWMHYNQTVDVWSVGCVMAELLTSKPLFPGSDHIDQLTRIMKLVGKPDMDFISKLTTDAARRYMASVPEYQKRPFSTVFTDANPKAVDLLEKMLDLDPDKRITAEQALAHPYLATYSDPEDEPTCEPFDELQFEAKDEEHWPTDKWRELVYNEILDFQMRKKEKDLASKEILDFQTRKEEKVPPEILARGPLALEAFIKALAEGIACVKRVPVMLIGQENAGKTSLKKSLRREPFNPDEDRTIGIEVDPSHFKVSTEIWKVGEKDQEKNAGTNFFYEYHTARLTVENLREEESIAKGGVSPEAVESSNIPLVKAAVGNVSSDSVSSATAVPSTSRHDSAKSLIDISEDPQSNEAISCLESTQTSRNAQLGGDKPDMPDDIATLIEVLLKEVDKVEDEEDIYSVLWDFAGQSVFYATHPLFLTTRAIYLLVNDLSQNPFERAKPIVTQGMFSQREDAFGVKTNVDYLDLWMSSVASLANENENHQEGHKSEVLTEKLPPVFLVCTHADTPYNGGDPNTLAQKVFGHLRSKPYKTHLYEDVFVVDNTKSGQESECSEIARLRKEVLALAKELPQLKEAIPIKWLRYEKALQTTKEDGQKWISLDTAKKIALEVCNIADEKQFQTLLNFLHDQRILIHFDDTPKLNKLVVLDPQWLIDVFKKVITIRPFNRKEKRFEELWRKLEEEGILEENLLEHIWGPLFDNKETPESLLEIMEKFSLLCSWPSSNVSCSKEYLVPSMLMSHPPEGITQLVASARFPSLFLKFESGKVPLGLFSRLVLHFIQWGKDQYTSAVVPQLYQNFARFYTSKDCSVVLLCHLSFIQVVVLGGCPILELADSLQSKLNLSVDVSYDTFEVTRAVRRQLELMLETMRNEFCWLKNMKYEVCFLCPVCCQGGKLNCCRKHRTEGCKEEECLHFWSESKLCNIKANLCLKSAVAHNPTVQVEQFAPWLTPTENQRAIDDNGKKLSPVEAGKEIALPSEVQASLLSESFDAKEVVLQLKESLQLDQASLEQPEPETKALICCLARKAKDSNRLDVFKHLREISPAGTTGPLLPEQLDVRSIPVAKGRELTIDLSGGEEWMVVAEGLGLTPQEIRFLNNRTLNPLEAALSFIARQRLLTVGELYDLLSRSGYPVLADLL